MGVPQDASARPPTDSAPAPGLLRPLECPSPWLSVGIGLGATGLALVVRLLMTPLIGSEAPFAIFLFSVLAAAWYGGLLAGLSASVLGSALGTWLYLENLSQHEHPGPTHEYLWFGLGLLIGSVITAVCESLHAMRRRAEQSLKALRESERQWAASEARFRRAIDEAPIPMLLHAEDGEVMLLSRTFCELTGYAPAELPTLARIFERLAGEQAGLAERARAKVFEVDERIDDGEFLVIAKDGRRMTWDFSSAQVGRLPCGRRLAVTMAKDVTQRKSDERELHRLQEAVNAAVDGIVITDLEGTIQWVNPAFTKISGYSRQEAIGQSTRMLKSGKHDEGFYRTLWDTVRSGRVWRGEIHNRRKDGTVYPETMTITPVRDAEGQVTNFIAIKEDISDKEALSAQLRQAQKMEAVGQLAGGVAHDFNNLLTVISGYSEILLAKLPPDAPDRRFIEPIAQAGKRAAALTRQLLAFSRKTMLEPQIVDLNAQVAGMEKMLARMIGEDVVLSTQLEPALDLVKVDPGQIDQVLMNLAVNARDAMPRGGKLEIQTRKVVLDAKAAARILGAKPGRYVLLSVTDSGHGMPEEVRQRIFEPFFTTKGMGKGTGLGLSVVHGIVAQSQGLIDVESAPGAGATFKLYFPAEEGEVTTSGAERQAVGRLEGRERVLLVEDDAGVRDLAETVLRAHGYSVVVAATGEEALAQADSATAPIDILVTDVVMPGISGRQVAEELAPRMPKMKVLYLSGYTDDAVVRHGLQESEVAFLQKPYAPVVLLAKVREVLDAP
ncbi:MAG: PAS domain S-box protein [Planctomycetes bacterium]|nr:PAS domain S-box protein [Planctomycetota bacterium]